MFPFEFRAKEKKGEEKSDTEEFAATTTCWCICDTAAWWANRQDRLLMGESAAVLLMEREIEGRGKEEKGSTAMS